MTHNKPTCLDISQISEYRLFFSSTGIVLQLSAIYVLIRYDIKILKGKMGDHFFFLQLQRQYIRLTYTLHTGLSNND